MQATPECFAHLAQLLQALAGGRVCAMLEVTVVTGRAHGPEAEVQAEGPIAPVTPCPPASSQGGYHLESLSESVCMTVQALLGDPAPPLSGPMVPLHRCRG